MPGPVIDGKGFHPFGSVYDSGSDTWTDHPVDPEVWRAWYVEQFQTIFGPQIDVAPDSPDGQFLTALATAAADMELVTKNVYDARSPAGAVGAGLSRLVQLNGITRKAARFSIAPVLLGGTPGTVVPAGSIVMSESEPELPSFATATDLTIGADGSVDGRAICSVAGPVYVVSGLLDKIGSVVAGWDTVTNPSAAAPGRPVESDALLRERRAKSVALASQAMTDGLYAALANLGGVDDVVVYENATASVDKKGLPPHSIRVVIDGGEPAEIAEAIRLKRSMGCTTVGAKSFTVLDRQGQPHLSRWDIPEDINVHGLVTLSATPSPPVAAAIKAALVAYGNETSRIGRTVPWADLLSPINALGITGGPGLPSVTGVRLGAAASVAPVQADLVVGHLQRPRFHESLIRVEGP